MNHTEEAELFGRFSEAMEDNRSRVFAYEMFPEGVAILHGLVALAADHPGVQDLSDHTKRVIGDFREWCIVKWVEMGLTVEEAQALDTLREAE